MIGVSGSCRGSLGIFGSGIGCDLDVGIEFSVMIGTTGAWVGFDVIAAEGGLGHLEDEQIRD